MKAHDRGTSFRPRDEWLEWLFEMKAFSDVVLEREEYSRSFLGQGLMEGGRDVESVGPSLVGPVIGFDLQPKSCGKPTEGSKQRCGTFGCLFSHRESDAWEHSATVTFPACFLLMQQ